MLRKVCRYIGFFLLTLSIGSYMYFACELEKAGRATATCQTVEIEILDKEQNKFVTEEEVLSILEAEYGAMQGQRLDSLDLYRIESILNTRSAIKDSDAYYFSNGRLHIQICQRTPILRIESENGCFVADQSGYIFPYARSFSSYVPVLSGRIGLHLDKDFRGRCSGEDSVRVAEILQIAGYVNRHPFWKAQIQQLYFDGNDDLILIPRIGDQQLVFGDMNDVDTKFDKLRAFYKTIVPSEGWNKYSTVNVKYRNQIICK